MTPKRKRKMLIFLICGALIIIGMIAFRQKLMVVYLVNTSIPAKEIPTEAISPCFRLVTDKKFPDNTINTKGLFEGGRDPSIFIRFNAEPNIIDAFVSNITKDSSFEINKIDIDKLNSGYQFFYQPSEWQKRLGLKLFDQISFRDKKHINGSNSYLSYDIIIDDVNNVVYGYFMSR